MSEYISFKRSRSLESSEFWPVCLFTCFHIWKLFLVDTDWCPGNARIVGTGSTNDKDRLTGKSVPTQVCSHLTTDKTTLKYLQGDQNLHMLKDVSFFYWYCLLNKQTNQDQSQENKTPKPNSQKTPRASKKNP